LEYSFDERAENFKQLFRQLDQASELGNNEQFASTLHVITEIAKSSPFKTLGNLASVKSALEDPEHTWEF
jgi:hypothetical protein